MMTALVIVIGLVALALFRLGDLEERRQQEEFDREWDEEHPRDPGDD
jgi:hypothetical protein